MSSRKVEALLNPTSIAILGARGNPSGWTARIFANFQRFGFDGPVWPVNPNHSEMWGVPCYPDLASLPGVPDHLVVMRAAATVSGILREAAALGTRSATLYAAGFSEIGTEEGRRLEDELRTVIEETGLAISGPNCLGSLSARAAVLTLPDDRIRELVRGPVAMVGQSGTTTPGIGRTLIDRGIDVGYIVTSGNETGLATADYIDYYVSDPDVQLIFCLIEAVRRPRDFLAACRRARDAGKPVIVLKMGASKGGRQAALAHTGSLAGAVEAFDAIAGDAGVIRVQSADEAVNLIELLVCAELPETDGVGVLVYSGGVRGLSLDAAERHNIPLPEFTSRTVAKIKELLGPETRVTNPLDATGFLGMKQEAVLDLIAAIRNDPGIGTLLFQDDLPPNEGLNDANRRRSKRVLDTFEAFETEFASKGGKPICVISPASADLTDFSRVARKRFPHLPCLNEPERAFRTLRQAFDYRDRLRAQSETADAEPAIVVAPEILADIRSNCDEAGVPYPLSEPDSKALLKAYGVTLPDEAVVTNADEAVRLADEIGYPVVIKGVAPALTHKSDAGAVRLGITNAEEVRTACREIEDNVRAFDASLALDGWLVAQAIPAGLELVIGIQRDPEMGPVVMFGMGGVWLELIQDVAFASPGLDRAEAGRLISRTRAGRLIDGYRGEGPFDRDAVIDTLVAVGRLADEAGDVLESLDINPFVVLPLGQGAYALDALAVISKVRDRG
jgi:acetyltransferase